MLMSMCTLLNHAALFVSTYISQSEHLPHPQLIIEKLPLIMPAAWMPESLMGISGPRRGKRVCNGCGLGTPGGVEDNKCAYLEGCGHLSSWYTRYNCILSLKIMLAYL